MQQPPTALQKVYIMVIQDTMRRFHFIGIGGSGMSGIAQMCLENGFQVSGSDLEPSFITRRLQQKGAIINFPHNKANVEKEAVVVISSAIPESNEELLFARETGLPVKKRAEMLGWLMKNRRGVAVAGTHGKTTTTSLISSILTTAGLDPTTIVGGEAQHVGGNAKAGQGEFLVAEADESDGSFLMLPVKYGLVTNVDNDHLNYYGSEENLRLTFQQFIESVSEFSILCGEDSFLYSLKQSIERPVFYYGWQEHHDYQIKNPLLNGRSSGFELFYQGQFLLQAKLKAPGLHNILNAAGAAALCHQLGVEPIKIVNGLANFNGIQRRFELIQEKNGIMIFDDYAHHPTELKATLEAAKHLSKQNGGQLVVCFQPHRYTRNKELAKRFANVLSENIDFLYLAPIYSAGEKLIPDADSWSIYRHLTMDKSRVRMLPEGNPADWSKYISGELMKNDILFTIGAGNITKLARLVQI